MHIDTKVYKEGTKPKGDTLSIRLNMEMDTWVEDARKWGHTILQADETEQFFYPENTVLVKIGNNYLYGNIIEQVRESISKQALTKYLMGKHPHWNEHIFQYIDWDSIGLCLNKLPATRVTNILKMVHGWQNDGRQKGLFYDIGEECECPAGCGHTETRFHYIQCKAPQLAHAQIKQKEAFKKKLMENGITP